MNYSFATIFDMDGVIVDSNPAHKIALKQFCKQHGHDLSDEQLREKIYGRTNKDWIPNVFPGIDDKTLHQYADEKEALFRKIYENDILPLQGLTTFLKKLDQYSIPRAIGTSAPTANVDFTLSKTQLQNYFKIILDDKFVTHGKPNPEIYLKCVAALKYPAEKCIVFEDSVSGVQAGKAAGCKVVGVTTTHTAKELGDIDLAIADFEELTLDDLERIVIGDH
jgi:HAD superfamily hydrolase (TIGR01509 family)